MDVARHSCHLGRLAVSFGLALALFSAPLAAADTADDSSKLQSLEQARAEGEEDAERLAREADALRQEIDGLRDEIIAAAKASQELEGALSAHEVRLAELEAERSEKQALLAGQKQRLAQTLGALQQIALRPADSLLASPGRPVDTLRSAMLLSYAVPEIETRAFELRRELASLDELGRDIVRERQALEADRQSLDKKRDQLGSLIGRKKVLEADTAAQQKQAQARARQLAREASDLKDLISRLEEEAQRRAEAEAKAQAQAEAQAKAAAEAQAKAEAEAEADRAAAAQQQQALLAPGETASLGPQPGNVRAFPNSPDQRALVLPVRGKVIKRYGESDGASGEAAKGLSIAARHGAQIVAPYDGQVAYAGPFRGYGQILIIEHGGRYHTLLAGLERVDVVEGQWLLAGEPVGIMSTLASSEPVLYLELRRTGQPINPQPWLAISNDKVQG